MIGIDTNILTRFFVQDDPQQSARVDSFLHKLTPNNPGFGVAPLDETNS